MHLTLEQLKELAEELSTVEECELLRDGVRKQRRGAEKVFATGGEKHDAHEDGISRNLAYAEACCSAMDWGLSSGIRDHLFDDEFGWGTETETFANLAAAAIDMIDEAIRLMSLANLPAKLQRQYSK